MKTNNPTPINENQFVLDQLPEEEGVIQVVVKDESIWATQKAMAQLFGCSTDNVSLHLKNIFASSELDKNSVTEKNSATATDGKNYQTLFYNLDAIISVGYRVNSAKATKFRIWATGVPQIIANEIKIPLKTKKPRSHVAFLV